MSKETLENRTYLALSYLNQAQCLVKIGALAKNISMKYIQHQLGHTTIKTTMDIYTHLLPEVSEQCVLALDSLVDFTEEPIKRFGT